MSRKFQRAQSSTSTYQFSQKPTLFEEDIEQISKSTIIPFVCARFAVVPKHPLTRSKKLLVSKSHQERNFKLPCHIIFSRTTNMVKNIVGHKLLKILKLNTFKEKLTNFVQVRSKQMVAEAFIKVKSQYNTKTIKEKLLQLNYICKKLKHNSISYAFRRILIFDASRSLDMVKTVKKKIQKQGEDEFNHCQQYLSKNFSAKKQQMGAEFYQLKPDQYEKSSSKKPVWKIVSRYCDIKHNVKFMQ